VISAVIGIDIGAGGACALLGTDKVVLLDVQDMPVLRDGPKSRPTVNAALLAALVRRWGPTHAYVEFVGPRPGEGAVQGFSFGRSKGAVEGVLAALAVPVTWLTAPTWKRAVGIPAGKEGAKDAARSDAIRRWPENASWFARVKDDGRAEAALIAVAGILREAQR
jgi:crossover junction endodeoxyribonuclease RuvC